MSTLYGKEGGGGVSVNPSCRCTCRHSPPQRTRPRLRRARRSPALPELALEAGRAGALGS